MNFLPGLMKTFSTDNIAAIGSSRSSQSREAAFITAHVRCGGRGNSVVTQWCRLTEALLLSIDGFQGHLGYHMSPVQGGKWNQNGEKANEVYLCTRSIIWLNIFCLLEYSHMPYLAIKEKGICGLAMSTEILITQSYSSEQLCRL